MERYILKKGKDYSEKERELIWQYGDKKTLKFLKNIDINGSWLNLAGGDERYNEELLKRVDSLIVGDIDKEALKKVYENSDYKEKLSVKKFNLANKFPFEDSSFDGVLCVGILQLFPEKILRKILREIKRVTKRRGKIILDIVTDIERKKNDNNSKYKDNDYSLEKAKRIFKEEFKYYNIRFVEEKVPLQRVDDYKFRCEFLLAYLKNK